MLRGADFEALSFVRGRGGELSAEGIAPGEPWLDLHADGHATELLPVTIASGERTSVSVTLTPGVARTLDFRTSGPRAWHDLEVCVRDMKGRVRAVGRLTHHTPEALLVILPLGSYTLEARADTGLAASGAFTIDALDVQDEALHFPLR